MEENYLYLCIYNGFVVLQMRWSWQAALCCLGVLWYPQVARGFSGGAPPTTCDDMVPKHRDTSAQNGVAPYIVAPSHPHTQDGKVRLTTQHSHRIVEIIELDDIFFWTLPNPDTVKSRHPSNPDYVKVRQRQPWTHLKPSGFDACARRQLGTRLFLTNRNNTRLYKNSCNPCRHILWLLRYSIIC
jgi:hypothetical protein